VPVRSLVQRPGRQEWDVRSGTRLCRSCVSENKAASRRLLEELWAEGFKLKEIAEVMGWEPEAARVRVSEFRAAGVNLPHRVSQKVVEQARQASARRWATHRGGILR
jgi:hypothetical protein